MRRGKFIVLEGGEGAGKSTNLEWIRDRLAAGGIKVITTREPGGTPFGEKLRSVLLDPTSRIVPDAELLLMFAARAQHLHEIIKPALESGSWVICDRFTDASYAYQGGGRGVNLQYIEFLEHWIQEGLYPDLVLLFDMPVETGLLRTHRRGNTADRFESEQRAFFERVREAYLRRAQSSPERHRVIDAALDLPQVQQQIEAALGHLSADGGGNAV
ncbi:MAG TPA: dTMP kinase [Gammaproteobacteria bacterium]|nr:dTMP kinase [Gammaproteobacteria bacterium]